MKMWRKEEPGAQGSGECDLLDPYILFGYGKSRSPEFGSGYYIYARRDDSLLCFLVSH
jgi:hypothetical protein